MKNKIVLKSLVYLKRVAHLNLRFGSFGIEK